MSRWRRKVNDRDSKMAKRPVSVSLTVGAIEFIREKLGTDEEQHETRSSYLEKMFWVGVREWDIAQDLKAKADHMKKPV